MSYTEYIEEHTANIKEVWRRTKLLLLDEFSLDDYTYWYIDDLIKCHDESKYNYDEFEGYRQWFFPADNEIKNQLQFDLAWNHHQKNNPHHWEYWIMYKNNSIFTLPMPFIYIFEMLCDWTAMSLKFKDRPTDFYNKNKDFMLLNDNTIKSIEKWLPLFEQIL